MLKYLMRKSVFNFFLFTPLFFYFLFAFSQSEFIFLSEIKSGDILTAKTRVDNNVMHRFPVKVISIVHNSGNSYPTILAESDDPLIVKTRIASGMSGSPVYAGERLAGAIAYTWDFLEKPIMGITPIEEMLPIIDYQGKEPQAVYGDSGDYQSNPHSPKSKGSSDSLRWYDFQILQQVTPEYFEFMASYPALSEKIDDLKNLVESMNQPFNFNQKSQVSLDTSRDTASFPIAMSWSTPRNNYSFRNRITDWGSLQTQIFPGVRTPDFSPIPIQGKDFALKDSEEETPLEPGDYIGINLSKGDLQINIFGTVTYVDEDTLLAFGHHMGQRGAIRLPLYRARTEVILPLKTISFKMGSLVREIGTVEQDRQSGILGKIGSRATYLPIEVNLNTPLRQETFRFEVADDKQLSSPIAGFGLTQIFAWMENAGQPVSLDYVIKLNYTTPSPSKIQSRSIVFSDRRSFLDSRMGIGQVASDMTQILHMVRDNSWEVGRVNKIEVKITSRPNYNYMQASVIRASRKVYRPGDVIHFEVGFDRYQKPRVYRKFAYPIPSDTPDGNYNLAVSSAQLRWLTGLMVANPYSLKNLASISSFLESRPSSHQLSIWSVEEGSSIQIKDDIYYQLPANQKKLLLRSLHNEKKTAGDIRYRNYNLKETIDGFLTLAYQVNQSYKD